MLDNSITELDRKSLMISLAIINNNLKLNKTIIDEQVIYNIFSIDNQININLNFNKKYNSFNDLKLLLEYSYNNENFAINKINDDLDLLEYIYKYFNAIIVKINNESITIENEKLNNELTKTQSEIFNKLILLENLCIEVYKKEPIVYSSMVTAKFITESIQQANLFISNLDLLDYIKVTTAFSKEVPCHEVDDIWLKFLTDMINFKECE